jgi:DDE_Tnp_1-associated/Transposase DDE domain
MEKELNNQPVRSLVEVLVGITDPRKAKGKRHSLQIVLRGVVLGLLCQQNSLRQIAIWAAGLEPQIKTRLQFRHGKAPSYGTLRRVMNAIDLEQLQRLLQEWVAEVVAATCPGEEWVGVAVDGKTLRHSQEDETGTAAVQMLNVLLHQVGVMLASQPVAAGTGETTTARQVLKDLALEGKVVTADAAHTKRPTARRIVKKGGIFSCA